RVTFSHLPELIVPDFFSVVENHSGELCHAFFFGIGLGVWLVAAALPLAAEVGQLPRIDAEDEGENDQQQSATTADCQLGAAAHAAAVLDIFAFLTVFPFHGATPQFRVSIRSGNQGADRSA